MQKLALVLFLFCVSTLAQRCMLDTQTQFYFGPLNLYAQPQSAGQRQSIALADVVFSMQPDGNIVVTEQATGVQVWTTGVKNVNCTGGCKCIMQGDGNFVCQSPGSSAYWLSWTYSCCGNPTAAIGALLSSQPPYLQFVNKDCNIVWSASGALPRTVNTPQFVSTGVISRQPLPSNRFIETFGVCTHLSQGWNPDLTLSKALYIGASAVRDGLQENLFPAYKKFHDAGVHMNVLPSSTNASDMVRILSSAMDQFPGTITSVEGFNEISNWPFTYNGVDPKQSYAGMAQAMKDLYNGIKSNPKTKNINVYDLTGGNSGPDSEALRMNRLDGFADFAAIHPYSYNGDQSVVGWSYFSENLNGDYPYWQQDTPRVITELGWPTLPVSTNRPLQGVTEIAQGKLTVNSILDAILGGFHQIFVYELLEERWGNTASYEEHFGLFYFDQTPKPAAEALHIITGLLKDTATGSLNALSYSIDGLPITTGKHLLFQMQSTPSYWLAIWNTAPVWDSRAQADVVNSAFTVTVKLGKNSGFSVANFIVYNPYSTLISGSPPANRTFTNTDNVQFQMSDYAMFVQIVPVVCPCAPSNLPSSAQAGDADTYQTTPVLSTGAIVGIVIAVVVALVVGVIIGLAVNRRMKEERA